MALRWDWKNKIGEVVINCVWCEDGKHKRKDVTYSLYQGNAYMICIYEYKEDGEDMYNLRWFWADKEHMKNMLGLNPKKGYSENCHEDEYHKWKKIRINKKKCNYFKDIIPALAQGFDDLDIEIYSEEKGE